MPNKPIRRGAVLLALTFACNPQAPETSAEGPGSSTTGPGSSLTCVPDCLGDRSTCGDDGCGGQCRCRRRRYCSQEQVCLRRSECTDTCASAGFECGSICDHHCGTCASGTCLWGRCVDVPNDESCPDCQLTLALIERQGTQVRLGIDFASSTGALPRMADLRIYTNYAAVTAIGAVAGDALSQAGKQLFVDPSSGSALRDVGKRTRGVLALSLDNTNLIGPGRLAEVTFDIGAVPSDAEVAFRLEKRTKTFAPAAADQAVQSEPYDLPVVVER